MLVRAVKLSIAVAAVIGFAYLAAQGVHAARKVDPASTTLRTVPVPSTTPGTPGPRVTAPSSAKTVKMPPLVVRDVEIVEQLAADDAFNAKARALFVQKWKSYVAEYALTPEQERACRSAMLDAQQEIARVTALREDAKRLHRDSLIADDLDTAKLAGQEQADLNRWLTEEQYPVLLDEMKARLAGILTPAQLDAFRPPLRLIRLVSPLSAAK